MGFEVKSLEFRVWGLKFRVWDLGHGTIGFHKAARALQGLGEWRTKWKTTTETGSVKVDVVLRV